MPTRKICLLISSIAAVLLLASLAGAANPARGGSDSHVLRLDNISLSTLTELDLHPRLALDYGAYLWLEVSGADLARLQASGLAYQEQSNPYRLRLGERDIDLSTDTSPKSDPGADLFLVQFAGPTQAAWLDRLRASGLSIVQYIHPYTYVVWGDAQSLEAAASLPYVHSTGDFAPEYRLLPRWRGLTEAVIRVNLVLYRRAQVTAVLQQVESLGGQSLGRAVQDAAFEIAQFTLPGSSLPAVSQLAGVYSIQPASTGGGLRGEMSDQINVGNYDASNLAFPGYPAWLDSAGVHGTGVIIANVDGGVANNHADLVNRFIACVGQTCGGSASSDHGTHTAGIMAADGSSGTRDVRGFLRGLGVAPGANLVEQVYSPWFTQPGGMYLLISDSYANGASLSGNSWGPSGYPVGYDEDTRQVDVGVRDADPDAAGNQAFTYVLSIMNGGGGYQSQGSPDEAKNIFTIGSTYMQTSGGGQMLNIDDLSANTAHGPALDERKIPHMVAPGCNVDSTIPGGYDLMCGTSMASPQVSGAVALFIEYYRNLMGVDPSPALIKAAYLPAAHDLAGHLDADGNVLGHPFDARQGWGRMDTAAVISPSLEVHYFDNPLIFDNTGEEWVQTLYPSDPAQPLKIMLVWTDAPGHGLGGSTPAWNNDLDLVVTVGGHTYRGNVFDSQGWSLPGAVAPDYMNNTEGVFLSPAVSGVVTAYVIASNISSDGIPNQGDDTDQDFALVCYNCASEPDFELTVQPAAQAFCAPVQAVYTATVQELGGFSQAVTLSAQGAPAESTLSFDPNPVLPTGESVLRIDNPVSVTAGSYAIVLIGAAVTQVHTATLGLDLYTLLPGAPEPLYPAAETNNVPVRPTFTWQVAAQASTYGIQIATDAAFTHIVDAADGLVVPGYTPGTDLEFDTIYFWRVLAHNLCGESEYSSLNRFLTEPAAGMCGRGTAPVTLFSEGFEDNPDWMHGGTGGDWILDEGRKHSGLYSYKATDEVEVSDQWLVSPELWLPSGQAPLTLSFWNYQYIENRLEGCVDGGILEISTDDGATWTQLDNQLLTDPYNGPVASGSGNPLAGMNAWCGKPQNWLASRVDLDEFTGLEVSFRFRLGTDNNLIGFEGWYVDDVSVQSCTPVAVLEAGEPLRAFAGQTVTHTLTLTNTGPADSFNLSLSDNAWGAHIMSANPVSVPAGAAVTILVQVQIPDHALAASDTFTLTAASVSVPGVKLTAQGTTLRLAWMNVFLPVMRK